MGKGNRIRRRQTTAPYSRDRSMLASRLLIQAEKIILSQLPKRRDVFKSAYSRSAWRA